MEPDKKKMKKNKSGFAAMGLAPELEKAIAKLGYKCPTPIQKRAIPVIQQGRDICAMARTGSGKTAAFLLPMLNKMGLNHSMSVGVRAVVLSPTRELAMQSIKVCRTFNSCGGDLRMCLLVGGQGMEAQFERLAQNPDIVFATPGRLMHHMVEAELALTRVEHLVFDEADRLFELGFADQLQKILDGSPPSRQCMLFSATLPTSVMQFSRLGMRDPEFIRLDAETTLSEKLECEFLYVRSEEKICAALYLARRHLQVGEFAYLREEEAAAAAKEAENAGGAIAVDGKKGKGKAGKKGKGKGKGGKKGKGSGQECSTHKSDRGVIMFCATRHHVEFFGTLFKKAGIKGVYTVYGNMDQTARNEQVGGFHRNRGILVTTDVAARGIDIPLLNSVINYDFPPSPKLFVHRAGRTARAGEGGLCSNLVTKDDLPYTLELALFLGRKLQIPGVDVSELDGSDNEEEAEEKTKPDALDPETLSAEQKQTKRNQQSVLGSVPTLVQEVEEVHKLFRNTGGDGGNDLESLHKSVTGAYKLYYKTRPAASKQSARRSWQLLEKVGGAQRLQTIVHPNYQDRQKVMTGGSDGISINNVSLTALAAANKYFDSLKNFRPTALLNFDGVGEGEDKVEDGKVKKARAKGKKGSAVNPHVLNPETTAAMAALVKSRRDFAGGCAELRQENKKARRAVDADVIEMERLAAAEKQGAAPQVGASSSKRKLSVRERKDLKRQKAASGEPAVVAAQKPAAAGDGEVTKDGDASSDEEGDDDFAGWNVSVAELDNGAAGTAEEKGQGQKKERNTDGQKNKQMAKDNSLDDMLDRTKGSLGAGNTRYKSGKFFLSTERTQEEDARDRGFDLEEFRLDMLADDGKGLQSQKSVMRWDARKKKYLPTLIGADGKSLKMKSRRNEAGAKVTGEAVKSDIYEKWAKTKKARIQKVGEMEGNSAMALFESHRDNTKGSTLTFDDDQDMMNDDTQDDIKKVHDEKLKKIIPFHGTVDEKYLTNKQKRLIKKHTGRLEGGVTSTGKEGGSITKHTSVIKKDRKKQFDRKMKNDKEFRKKEGQKKKEEYWERHAAKIKAKEARPRSFKIFVGGRKEQSKKMEKRRKVRKSVEYAK